MKRFLGIPTFICAIFLAACNQVDTAGPGPDDSDPRGQDLATAASTQQTVTACMRQGGYIGNLTVTNISNNEWVGTMDWFNHSDATVRGTLSPSYPYWTFNLSFAYSPNLAGYYSQTHGTFFGDMSGWTRQQRDAAPITYWASPTRDDLFVGPEVQWSATAGPCPG